MEQFPDRWVTTASVCVSVSCSTTPQFSQVMCVYLIDVDRKGATSFVQNFFSDLGFPCTVNSLLKALFCFWCVCMMHLLPGTALADQSERFFWCTPLNRTASVYEPEKLLFFLLRTSMNGLQWPVVKAVFVCAPRNNHRWLLWKAFFFFLLLNSLRWPPWKAT